MAHESQIQALMWILGLAGATLSGLILWAVKALITATLENTKTNAVLSSQMEKVLEAIQAIPKIKQDLHELHSWRRYMEKKND